MAVIRIFPFKSPAWRCQREIIKRSLGMTEIVPRILNHVINEWLVVVFSLSLEKLRGRSERWSGLVFERRGGVRNVAICSDVGSVFDIKIKGARLICKICLIVLQLHRSYIFNSILYLPRITDYITVAVDVCRRKASMKINCLYIDCDRSILIGRTEQMGYSQNMFIHHDQAEAVDGNIFQKLYMGTSLYSPSSAIDRESWEREVGKKKNRES